MKVIDVISRVRSMSGDTSVLQFSNDDVLTWINDGIIECARQNNLLQKRATQTVVTGQAEYTLPADILKLYSVKYDGNKLPVLTLEEFDEQYSDSSLAPVGTPITSYLWADQVNLHPKPDNSTKALTIDYIYRPETLLIENISTDDVPLPISYHQRIVDYCLAQVAQQDDNLNRYQLKMQEFRTGVQELKDQHEYAEDLYPYISVDSRDMGDGYYDG